ncbi:hypothetical protein CGRA01v4_12005 [Colletotrichum graminicola]|nr:hypothetical protein CGRA01v4_12005 [Colletotrichum graminicola]
MPSTSLIPCQPLPSHPPLSGIIQRRPPLLS